MNRTQKIFSERLAQLMEARAVDKQTLARELRVSLPVIDGWLASRKPRLIDLVGLVTFFRCPADYLLGLSNDPNPP